MEHYEILADQPGPNHRRGERLTARHFGEIMQRQVSGSNV